MDNEQTSENRPRLTGLAALAARAAGRSKTPRLKMDLNYTSTDISFDAKLVDFTSHITTSASGEGVGVFLDLSGEYDTVDPATGEIVTVSLRHARGGGAWLMVDETARRAPKAKEAKA